MTALQKHPVTKYISRALLGLASLCLKLEPLPPAIRGNRKARIKAEQDRAKEEKITYTLIDSMERAVFEGDMEWFKKQYDSVIDQEEKLFDASQHGDDYESQTGVIRCQGCNGFHI